MKKVLFRLLCWFVPSRRGRRTLRNIAYGRTAQGYRLSEPYMPFLRLISRKFGRELTLVHELPVKPWPTAISGYIVRDAEGKKYYLSVAFTDATIQKMERIARAQAALAPVYGARMSFIRPLASGWAGPARFQIAGYVDAKPLPEGNGRMFAILREAYAKSKEYKMSPALARRAADEAISNLDPTTDKERVRKFPEYRNYIEALLRAGTIRLANQHTDFCGLNVLRDWRGRLYLIDFEHFAKLQPASFDWHSAKMRAEEKGCRVLGGEVPHAECCRALHALLEKAINNRTLPQVKVAVASGDLVETSLADYGRAKFPNVELRDGVGTLDLGGELIMPWVVRMFVQEFFAKFVDASTLYIRNSITEFPGFILDDEYDIRFSGIVRRSDLDRIARVGEWL